MNMIEHAARAMDPWAWDWAEYLDPEYRAKALNQARAVIAAMRKPTGAMLEAAREADYEDVSELSTANDLIIWKAMIDAALEDHPE